jgi:hypothetical protein
MKKQIPFVRRVNWTNEVWYTTLYPHCPPAARWLSMEDIFEIRQKHRRLGKRGARPAYELSGDPRYTRFTSKELARLFTMRNHHRITIPAIDYVVRIPHEMIPKFWMSQSAHQLDEALVQCGGFGTVARARLEAHQTDHP